MENDSLMKGILQKFNIADLVKMPDSLELQKIIAEHKDLLSLDEIQQLKKLTESIQSS